MSKHSIAASVMLGDQGTGLVTTPRGQHPKAKINPPEAKRADARQTASPRENPHNHPTAGGDEPPPSEAMRRSRKTSDKRRYRAVFISDTHLGTRAARADLLLDFLKSVECEQMFLVGDIIDGWRLKKNWYWDTVHNDVIRRILKLAKSGTEVTYIPGNHDEGLRGFTAINMAGVKMQMDAIFEGATGKKYWVIHGDEFDGVVKYAKWLAVVGDWAYVTLLKVNTGFNWVRRKLGYSYWSLSAYLKHKVKNAVEFIGNFEEAVAAEAQRRGVDGVICGHIHHAERRMIGDVEYLNDGDWVESCTALVEHDDGRWEILYWADILSDRLANTEKKRKHTQKKRKKAEGRRGKPAVAAPAVAASEEHRPAIETPPLAEIAASPVRKWLMRS